MSVRHSASVTMPMNYYTTTGHVEYLKQGVCGNASRHTTVGTHVP